MNKICILLIMGAAFNFLVACGNSSSRIEENIQNSQRLRVGMKLEDALNIMGEPYEIKAHANYKKVYDYYYESPHGSSDWIYFSVDSTKRVIEIAPYETE